MHGASAIIPVVIVETSQVKDMIDQMVQRMLEATGKKLSRKIDRL